MDKKELIAAIAEGLSQRKLASKFNCSQTTIRYWLAYYGLKTLAREKKQAGQKYAEFECDVHGFTQFVLEGRGSYRCMKCRSGRITEARRALKQEAVEVKGSCCVICGYDKCIRALQFHHLERESKEYEIGDLIARRKRELLLTEIEKCILVCANCHAEIEDGLVVPTVER